MSASERELCIVLVEPHHPGNIGAVARAMANMGAHELRLVNPCPLDEQSRAMAWGALHLLDAARFYTSFEEAVADCQTVVGFSARDGRFRLQPRFVAAAAEELRERTGRLALVFGREDAGLRFDEIERCHMLVRIPTPGTHSSLNLAQSVLLGLYEFEVRASNERSVPQDTVSTVGARPRVYAGDRSEGSLELDSASMERLLADWERALVALGYAEFGPDDLLDRTTRRLRRILFRAGLERNDADLLFGVARRICGSYRIPGSKGGPVDPPAP